MNEITRIHLAKTPYDVEVAAKKELEKYIKSVERYAGDADVVLDVEIRMTELLAERGVVANGVVSSADVRAIRTQLGEPHEFANEDLDGEEAGDMAIGPDEIDEPHSMRKLYRNLDDAVLGGVLSGMASYFRVNAAWTRLIFVILLFVSFGLVTVLYFIFWLIIPPARTAAEKLQMTGKKVTLSSIRQLNETETSREVQTPILQTVLRVATGIISLFAAIGTFCVSLWGAGVALTSGVVTEYGRDFSLYQDHGLVWVIGGLVFVGLMLLATMFAVIAYSLLLKRYTKRVGVSLIIIVISGIVVFASTVGIGVTQSIRASTEAQRLAKTVNDVLPQGFTDVKKLAVERGENGSDRYSSVAITYIVDSGKPRYEFHGLPGTKPALSLNGDSATLKMQKAKDGRSFYIQPTLTVYGPALESVTNDGANLSYQAQAQDTLAVQTTGRSMDTTVSGGTYKTVTVTGESASVSLGSAVIESLVVNGKNSLQVSAGTVRNLTVTQPDVCQSGASSSDNSVSLSAVTSGVMTYNGTERKAESYRTSCASVIFESPYDGILEEVNR